MEIVVLANRYKVHHFRSIEGHFAERFVYEGSYDTRAILRHNPALVICFDEHWCELGNAIGHLKEAGVATLQVMDGILEWRRTWDYRREGKPVDGVVNPLNQPALSHKIACLGHRDAEILESWGNAGKCEIVGAPRLDGLVRKRLDGGVRPAASSGRKPRILVMTAKTPGFTELQIETTTRSLADLRQYFAGRQDLDVVWRVTQGLEKELGIRNTLADLTGGELHRTIEEVEAVITTPSTAMLEAMLLDRPVALLDYHNCPHYFEAAWSITAKEHIAPVVAQILAPPAARFDFQTFLLHRQLACASPAAERLVRLIEAMLAIRKTGAGDMRELPTRLLADGAAMGSPPLPLSDLRRYYPHFSIPVDADVRELRTELAAARGTIEVLGQRLDNLTRQIESIPGYLLLRAMARRLRAWRRR